MTTSWVELQIETAAEAAEIVAAALAPLVEGVEIRDAETVFPTARDRAAVIALCPPDEVDQLLAAVEETLATARAAGATVDPVTLRRRPAHEDEWRDVWKQFFRTTRIGRRFVVRPSWDPEGAAPTDQVIDLDPGRAFGTGAHPSTKLCVAAMERLADEGHAVARFLDLGCGSGILAIAASRLWPRAEGVAVDLDPESAECAAENLALNRVTTVTTAAGSLEAAAGERFDLILANIQADVLATLVDDLAARLAPQGRLVLSGLLVPDADPLLARYQQRGFSLAERGLDGEWASLVLAAPT